ncbi:MAG: SDR family oxidoreductase [Actinophytocola sp.]|uniref:SDR family oxidoreductase n=1 Tax=Actinophytocola sp. TaxID=1872138 RepID=UPI003C780D50
MTGGPLQDKVALVTGGAGSVGERVVRMLADAGATVLINCFHSYDAAKALAAELVAAGHRAEVIRGSVAKPAQVARMFEQIEQTHGRLDILVNNAAAGTFVGLDEMTEEHLDQAFTTNVKGALWCARAARPLLARADGGCIVNVSSIGASHAPANYLAVGVSKAALEALTRYLAAEFAPDGIRVNTASAALIDNEVGRMFPGADSVTAKTMAATPLGRLGTPDDLAGAVMMLVSPHSRWVTGQTVLADGGLSLLRDAMAPDQEERVAEAPTPVSVPEDADPVVVVGTGIAVPGASSPEEFWALLNEGAELFVDAPADRWRAAGFHDPDPRAPDKSYQSRSGFMTGFRPHDRLAAELPAWGESPEFTAVWLRHCAYQALEQMAAPEDGARYSVCLGYTPDGSQHLYETLIRGEIATLLAEDDANPADERLARDVARLNELALPTGADGAVVPTPHRVGLAAFDGLVPADSRLLMVDTACSSSLYAIDLGVRELLSGRADVALCGGAFALAPGGSVLFSKVQGLSRGGAVRALDRTADGVLFSDGAGIVALKRLSRALADGDRVLGVLAGTGLSADGKGKAIYAPSSTGQRMAINRAFDRSGLGANDIDWVIAHATGTPAGDEAEFLALRAEYEGAAPVRVTSNKSLIGHTGWAAGVVSLIHALLGMEHDAIPAQYRFTSAPDAFGMDGTNLAIPVEPVPWPATQDRPRAAAVSGFGFGGTNAHLLVQEYRAGHTYRTPTTHEDRELVLVGWSGHLPGVDDLTGVEAWARGDVEAAESFGTTYPRPPFQRLRLPAAAVRATDRTQLMVVECMQRLPEAVRTLCEEHRNNVGVVVGHTGPTRNATLYGLRAYLDELDRIAGEDDGIEGREQLMLLLKRVRSYAFDRIDAPSEDSFPGEMPNVIPARLCNYFDLRGLNIAVDAGTASLAEAFATARRYLEFGDIDVALVAGVNGNTLPSWREMAADGDSVREGALLFALTTRELAESAGLPVLAEYESTEAR